MKEILKVLFNPSESLEEVLRKSPQTSLIYAFALASIGSILSFISLYFFEREPVAKVLLYSVVIYALDIISVLLFSFYLSVFLSIKFPQALNISVFASVPVWISDIVDIYQPLRFLSVLGLFYSIYILFLWFRSLSVENKKLHIGIYVSLYFANALISEAIFKNPLVKKFIGY